VPHSCNDEHDSLEYLEDANVDPELARFLIQPGSDTPDQSDDDSSSDDDEAMENSHLEPQTDSTNNVEDRACAVAAALNDDDDDEDSLDGLPDVIYIYGTSSESENDNNED